MSEKSHGQSNVGVDLTDEVLAQMAAESETGLDISKLRRRPGRNLSRVLRPVSSFSFG